MIGLVGHGLVAYAIDCFWHQYGHSSRTGVSNEADTYTGFLPQFGAYNENRDGLTSVLGPVSDIKSELDYALELFDDHRILAAEAYSKLISGKMSYDPEYCNPTALSYPVRGNERFKQVLAAGHFEGPFLYPSVISCLPDFKSHFERFTYFGKGDRSLRTFERSSFNTAVERFDFINGSHLSYSGSKIGFDYHGFSYKGLDFILILLENDMLESKDYLNLNFGFVRCIWKSTTHGGGGDSGNVGTPIYGYETIMNICPIEPYVYNVLNFGHKQIVVLDVRRFDGIGQCFIVKQSNVNVAVQSFRVIKSNIFKILKENE